MFRHLFNLYESSAQRYPVLAILVLCGTISIVAAGAFWYYPELLKDNLTKEQKEQLELIYYRDPGDPQSVYK